MAFQMMFAVITPALITGAFAERMRFGGCVLFLALWSIFVYAPVAHWVWGGGFLGPAGVGALDFAGGTVVHVNAGAAALAAAIYMGRPRGYGTRAILPHNVPMVVLAGLGLRSLGDAVGCTELLRRRPSGDRRDMVDPSPLLAPAQGERRFRAHHPFQRPRSRLGDRLHTDAWPVVRDGGAVTLSYPIATRTGRSGRASVVRSATGSAGATRSGELRSASGARRSNRSARSSRGGWIYGSPVRPTTTWGRA